jgi:hypothetical protein
MVWTNRRLFLEQAGDSNQRHTSSVPHFALLPTYACSPRSPVAYSWSEHVILINVMLHLIGVVTISLSHSLLPCHE